MLTRHSRCALSDSPTVSISPPAPAGTSLVEVSPTQPGRRGLKPYAYIYTLEDPRTNEIRYVGKAFDLKKRYEGHIYKTANNHRGAWVKSLMAAGVRPRMEVIEEIYEESDAAWEEAERCWISSLRFYGFRLVNADNGGNSGKSLSAETRRKISVGQTGKKVSDETRRKHSESTKGRKRPKEDGIKRWVTLKKKGWSLSIEAREKIRIKKTGIKLPPERLARLIAFNKGKKLTPEQRAKISLAAKRHWDFRKLKIDQEALWKQPNLF